MSEEKPCCLCNGCGIQTCKEKIERFSHQNPADNSWEYLCEKCVISVWPNPVYFVFHPGVPKEVREKLKSAVIYKRFDYWFNYTKDQPCPIHVFHRRESETFQWHNIWLRYEQNGRPRNPYSYRGFCSHDHIVLLYDETETLESMEWLLYHELGHHVCNGAKMIDRAMAQENTNDGRTKYEWEDDDGHEADSEERLVNRVATAFMGGKEYSRPWWRPRVLEYKKKLEEEKNAKKNTAVPEPSPPAEVKGGAGSDGGSKDPAP